MERDAGREREKAKDIFQQEQKAKMYIQYARSLPMPYNLNDGEKDKSDQVSFISFISFAGIFIIFSCCYRLMIIVEWRFRQH